MTHWTTTARRMIGIGMAWAALAVTGGAEAQTSPGTIFDRDNNSTTLAQQLCSVKGDGTGNVVLMTTSNGGNESVSNDLYTYQGQATRRWLRIVSSATQSSATALLGSGQLFVLMRDASGNAVQTQVSNFNEPGDGYAIATPATPPSWSPDDAYAYFTVANENVSPPQISLVRFPTQNFDLGIPATKDNVEYLTTLSATNSRTLYDYAVSPDGGTLALIDMGTTPPSLVLIDLATQAQRTIVSGNGTSNPRWSSDGGRIAYLGTRTLSTGQSFASLYTIQPKVAGATPQLIQQGGNTTTWGQLNFGGMAWSPDSTALAFYVRATSKKGTLTYWIGKSSSTGGAITQLTSPQAPTGATLPQAWLP